MKEQINKAKTIITLSLGIIIALAVLYFGSVNTWAANVSNQTELEAALSGIDTIITLTDNIELTSNITVNREVTLTASGSLITLNTAGYSIIVASEGNLYIDGDLTITGSGEQTIKVQSSGTLNLINGDIVSAHESVWHSAIYAEGGGTVNISGGTVVSNDNRSEGAIYANGQVVTVNVSGGVITGYSNCIKLFHNDPTSDRNTVTISGGTITATAPETVAQTHGLWVEKGNVTINGDAEINAQFPLNVNVGSVNISAGTFAGSSSFKSCSTVDISGGTFNGSITIDDSTTATFTGGEINDQTSFRNCETVEISDGMYSTSASAIYFSDCGNATISGGTFSGSVGVNAESVDSGKSVSISGDAQITGTTYGVYCSNGAVTISDEDVIITGGYGLYLRSGGKTTISAGSVSGNSFGGIYIENGGELILTGGTITNVNNNTGTGGIYIMEDGLARITTNEDLTIDGNVPIYCNGGYLGITGPQIMAIGETNKRVDLSVVSDMGTWVYAATTSTQLSATAGGSNSYFYLSPSATGSYNLVIECTKGGKDYVFITIPVSVVYSVTYDANGGTGIAPSKIYKDNNESFTTIVSGSFTPPSDKQFKEWNTAIDGSGTSYSANTTITMPANNLILYAIWEDIPLTYTAGINPTSRTFTAATVGYSQQAEQAFTITNTRTGAITGLSAALTTGTNFEISTALSAGNINSGNTAAVSVRPKTGLGENTYIDTLTITGNNGISLTVNLEFTVNPVLYTITASAGDGGSISPSGAVSVASGNSQNFTITPGSGYRINTVTVDGVDQGAITSYTFLNVTSGHAINATFTGRGGGGNGGSSSSEPSYKAGAKTGNNAESALPVIIDKNTGAATVDTGTQSFPQGGWNITVPAIPDVDTYIVGISIPALSMNDEKGTLTFDTDLGSMTVPANMLTGLPDISGSKAEITISQADKSNLPEDVKDAVGDRPILRLTLSIDGRQTDWSNPDAPITVSIPYTPTAAELEDPGSIVIWYIDGSGNVVSVPNGHYNADTGTVDFTTTHFSYFAVSYKKVSFKDVEEDAWYSRAVSFIAARDITAGTGNGNYSPEAKLTRGEFIVLMMRAYDITPDIYPSENFSDAGNTYYTGYLAAAKRLGISAGVGNNLFAPGKEITRQEMFTLLYNALKAIDKLPRTHEGAENEAAGQPKDNSGKLLSDFSDADDIAPWAKDAIKLLVETGTITGSGGRLLPDYTTTRAQMAQMLYNLLSK